MIDDPYQVLGVPKGSSEAEIKKAYRKRAKEWHPDLHPNDPNAAKKMNEINEAYDILMNPDKYAARQQQEQQREAYRQQHQNQNGYGNSHQQQNPGGWAGDFGFDFDDFFGFGYYGDGSGSASRPNTEPGDSIVIQRAVQAINNRQYQAAVSMLANVISTDRNARWYYLNAVANYGCGNMIGAMDHIQRAIQMDPNNQTYQQLYRRYRRGSQTYETNAQDFTKGAAQMQKMCLGLCAAQFCCNPYGMMWCC